MHLKLTVKVFLFVCFDFHVWEWNFVPMIIILLYFKIVFPCFLGTHQTEYNSVKYSAYGVESWNHWTLTWPVCFSSRSSGAKCLCMFHWENAVFDSCLHFSFYSHGEEFLLPTTSLYCETYTDGLVQGSLKGTEGRYFCFGLFFLSCVHHFPLKMCIMHV